MTTHSDSSVFAVSEEQLILKYRAVIHEIGPMVEEFLPHGILIFFGENAPSELREVSLIHDGSQLLSPITPGDMLRFSSSSQEPLPSWYRLTAVGDVANTNLAELGHIVVHFDAATQPNLPGAVSVEPSLTALPTIGTTIELFGLEKH